MKRMQLSGLTLMVLLLAACSAAPAGPRTSLEVGAEQAGIDSDAGGPAGLADLARSDDQGAVTFVVTPLNLLAPGDTLDFSVSMDTHSVDLGWDLAALSTLRTDTGREVPGLSWPVGGSHHYQGTLSFPAATAGGEALLAGARSLTLTIRGTDIAERVFTWDIAR
jgi:hypothetical protein